MDINPKCASLIEKALAQLSRVALVLGLFCAPLWLSAVYFAPTLSVRQTLSFSLPPHVYALPFPFNHLAFLIQKVLSFLFFNTHAEPEYLNIPLLQEKVHLRVANSLLTF